MSELDKFISSQAKLQTLSKEQGKSINILNLQYKMLNKTLGPFYTKYVEIKNNLETVGEIFESVTEKTEKLGDAVKVALGPIGGFLKILKQINTIMIFVLGAFALVGAAIFVLSKQFGGGEEAMGAFNVVIEAAKGLVDAFVATFKTVAGVIGGIDFSGAAGTLMPLLEGVFVVLSNVLALYITFYTAVIQGIGEIVTRMDEAGLFQRIADAFGVFFGLVGMAFGIIMNAFKDTGLSMGDLIDGIKGFIKGIVDFLFDSGIIEFAVKVIEYVAVFAGAIAVLAGMVISIFIRVWTQLGPPLLKFVKAFFGFLEPIVRIVTGILGVIMDAVMALFASLLPHIETAMDSVMAVLQPVIDLITGILEGAGKVLDVGSKVTGGIADKLGFSEGGVASGPTSGYPVTLHGTEAIVPLPDGRTIPVSIKGDVGGRGGQVNNISINVSGGGNAREIAKAVSDEVSKVLRNRSRGGNFTRGVI